jgi:uroporphyrinogen III methyltransferase / synthase
LNTPTPHDSALPVPSDAFRPRPAARWRSVQAVGAALLVVLALTALTVAWSTQQRAKGVEQELVRRQADSQRQAAEALVLARAAQELARESAAKSALLEARVAEASMQRSQIEELLTSVSRSRDENVVADVEAAIRVALQQSALTGSAEPLVATLKQTDERLARYNQPRLERVRRAVNRDLDRVKALGVVDIGSLTVRLDEAVRLVDELPLLALAEPRGKTAARSAGSAAAASAVVAAASGSASAGAAGADWRGRALQWWQDARGQVADEIRSLVRVTRIDHPEAMLIAPEQQFFVRENLKLRLLNARLALLSRQFEIAQTDIRAAQATLERYFERNSKRAGAMAELLRQVSTQARQTSVPRPDETLAALATAAAGR